MHTAQLNPQQQPQSSRIRSDWEGWWLWARKKCSIVSEKPEIWRRIMFPSTRSQGSYWRVVRPMFQVPLPICSSRVDRANWMMPNHTNQILNNVKPTKNHIIFVYCNLSIVFADLENKGHPQKEKCQIIASEDLEKHGSRAASHTRIKQKIASGAEPCKVCPVYQLPTGSPQNIIDSTRIMKENFKVGTGLLRVHLQPAIK